MKIALAVLLSLFLTGCSVTDPFVRKEVVVEYQYVIRKASEQQKALPPHPGNLDVETADQSDLAKWLAEKDKRESDLESLIKRLIEFYEQTPTEEEKAAAKKGK